MTAMASFVSMRRILDVTASDPDLLAKIEDIMYPCLLHSLQEEDRLVEGVYSINFIAHHAYKSKPFSKRMWKLFASIIYICIGKENDYEVGYGMEYIKPISICIKTFISRDPEGVLQVGEKLNGETYLAQVFKLIEACLSINRRGLTDYCGAKMVSPNPAIDLVIAMFENMQGKVNEKVPSLVNTLVKEMMY